MDIDLPRNNSGSRVINHELGFHKQNPHKNQNRKQKLGTHLQNLFAADGEGRRLELEGETQK